VYSSNGIKHAIPIQPGSPSHLYVLIVAGHQLPELSVNVAVTDTLLDILEIVHLLSEGLGQLVQLEKIELPSGNAVRVMVVPSVYPSPQSEPQFIPAGDEETVPFPVPFFETLTFLMLEARKIAVTFLFPSILTLQVGDVPAQPPNH
jgi:hypothetical protein